MAVEPLILAIDQGTTSSRALVFNQRGESLAVAQQEFDQHFPQAGWVEHDPEQIWSSTLQVCRKAIATAEQGDAQVQGIAITNQRETVVVWDRQTGQAIYNAIVWQDRRTASYCQQLAAAGHEPMLQEKTGLLLDPYFSASKIGWILDHVAGARARAERGELLAGTIDSFLLWRLTAGRVHATDASNASRTALFNIHSQQWDDELLTLFAIPRALLAEVYDSAADFGSSAEAVLGRAIPILAMAGDQQAAAIGQACFKVGDIKSTYGTGCFVMLNTGEQALRSNHRLLTTVAYRLEGKVCYALEGSIFVAGAAVQWLRDGLGVIDSAAQTQQLAEACDGNEGVYLVPGFTGLGAPHWDPDARGAIFGLTRNTGPAHFARACLESVCYQTRDLLVAMAADGVTPKALRVDGGMVANDWLMQFLADTLALNVDRPSQTETTALGVAYLAGLQAGWFSSLDDISQQWQLQRRFTSQMPDSQRQSLLAGWDNAVASCLSFKPA